MEPSAQTLQESLAPSDASDQFLLADFENLRDFVDKSDSQIEKRTEVLLTFVSILGAGIVYLSQSHIDKTNFLFIALFVAVSTLAISIVTFHQVLIADIFTTDYIRGLNRIRRYYATRYPHIKSSLQLPIDVTIPKYGRSSRNREVIAVLNCLIASLLAGLLCSMVYGIDISNPLVITAAIGAFATVAVMQTFYALFIFRYFAKTLIARNNPDIHN